MDIKLMDVKFNVSDDTLKINLIDKIDSNNSEEYEKECERILEENEHDKLILDAYDLLYTSSAGLRIILKLAKKENDFKVINVSNDVYEIFEMTGFTSMMTIEKARRKVSIEGAELIGKGFFSEVYRIDKDTIVKVFIKANSFEEVEDELKLAKQAFILGIPTAISYDIADVNGKPGMIFEMFDCKTLSQALNNEENRYDELVDIYTKLVKEINTTDSKGLLDKRAKDKYREKFELVKQFVDDDEYDKLISMFNEIPDSDTFVHGDCQVKNVMIKGNEAFLIDMETLSVGDPIFELAGLYATYVAFVEKNPQGQGAFLGIPDEMVTKLFTSLVVRYFKGLDEKTIAENVDKIAVTSYVHMLWWIYNYDKEDKEGYKKMTIRLKERLQRIDSLILKMN